MISNRRIYLTEDGEAVEDGDTRAHTLLVGEGCQIHDTLVKKHSLVFPEPEPVLKPLTEADLIAFRMELDARAADVAKRQDELTQMQSDFRQEQDTHHADRDALSRDKDALSRDKDALVKERDALADQQAAFLQEKEELRADKEAFVKEKEEFAMQQATTMQQATAVQTSASDGAKAVTSADDKAVKAAPENKAIAGPAETK